MINLLELSYTEEIKIDQTLSYNDDYLKDTEIISLNDVHALGNIKKDVDNSYLVNVECNGQMLIHDSVTYDEILFPFNVNIEENLENSIKSLDLMEFLWHYIVLEIPLRYTISDISNLNNENVKIMSEEEYNKKNNPFNDFFVE